MKDSRALIHDLESLSSQKVLDHGWISLREVQTHNTFRELFIGDRIPLLACSHPCIRKANLVSPFNGTVQGFVESPQVGERQNFHFATSTKVRPPNWRALTALLQPTIASLVMELARIDPFPALLADDMPGQPSAVARRHPTSINGCSAT